MDLKYAINQLERNKNIIYSLLKESTKEEYTWKQSPKEWNLLIIICHLYDEEVEDFRTRFKNVLETPDLRPPSFDPVAWIKDRKYDKQNFDEKLSLFLMEREKSLAYLKGLKKPKLNQGYDYRNYGYVDGKFFLSNWVAHDYLHIKQIIRLKYDYLEHKSKLPINYAGKWT